jgi:hypothetical protein
MTSLSTLIFTNRHVHKIIAVCIGIATWAAVSTLHDSTVTVTVPLCFYQTENIALNSALPQAITVTLKGPRQQLQAIDYQTLAAHVDAQTLQPHKPLNLTAEHFFLPKSIKLVYYNPINVG